MEAWVAVPDALLRNDLQRAGGLLKEYLPNGSQTKPSALTAKKLPAKLEQVAHVKLAVAILIQQRAK